MKSIKYLLTGILAVGLFPSCLKEYQDLNTNPEQMGEADPVHVFTGATRNFNDNTRDCLTGKYGNMVKMQYLVSAGGASSGAYVKSTDNNPPSFSIRSYTDYYSTQNDDADGGFGLRLNYLISYVIPNQENPDQYKDLGAIAKILLTYKQWQMLDVYGAAPITEAFRVAEGNKTPQYDLYQESLAGEPMYKTLDAQIKEAVATLKSSNDTQVNLGVNDFFYGGDVSKWIKAGNTIRVKMAQRLEKRDNAFYNEVINEVLTSESNVIANAEESFIYNHSLNYGDNTDDIEAILTGYDASATLVNFLKAYDDPRLPILVRKNGFGDANHYFGNDATFETFQSQFPELKYKRTDATNKGTLIEDFNYFTERYVGAIANPALVKDDEQVYGVKNFNAAYKDGENDATLNIRLYSQFEGRFFVKNGGRHGSTGMQGVNASDHDGTTGNNNTDEYYIEQTKFSMFVPLITYPEACFMYAEIAVKKGGSVAGKDADAWFKAGIEGALRQTQEWAERVYVPAQVNEKSNLHNPIDDAKIAAYLARPEFQTATLEKIISQQWVNLFMQPEEMWATWKRTGLPAFKDGEDVDAGGKNLHIGVKPAGGVAYFETLKSDEGEDLSIPRRGVLPTPNSLNMTNWEAAVSKLLKDSQFGGMNGNVNSTDGRIWWDAQ